MAFYRRHSKTQTLFSVRTSICILKYAPTKIFELTLFNDIVTLSKRTVVFLIFLLLFYFDYFFLSFPLVGNATRVKSSYGRTGK